VERREGREGVGRMERGGRARLGYLSRSPRVPSYATVERGRAGGVIAGRGARVGPRAGTESRTGRVGRTRYGTATSSSAMPTAGHRHRHGTDVARSRTATATSSSSRILPARPPPLPSSSSSSSSAWPGRGAWWSLVSRLPASGHRHGHGPVQPRPAGYTSTSVR